MLDWLGVHLPSLYRHCPGSSSGCSVMQWVEWLGGVHLPSIYMHCPRSSSGCSGMQDLCSRQGHMKCNCIQAISVAGDPSAFYIYALTRGVQSVFYIYMHCPADLAVGVVLCKSSMLEWLGVHLPSIYMHFPRSSSGCSGMQSISAQLTGRATWKCNGIQGIYAWLTGGVHLPSIYMHCPWSSSGCSGMQVIYTQMTGGAICLLYICTVLVLDLAVGVYVMQVIYTRVTGVSICLLYICIVLDLALGVVVCMVYVLNWLGGSICLLYICIVRSSSGCSGMKDFYIQMTWEDPCCMVLCFANVFGVVVFNSHMLDWLRGPSAFFIYVLS